MAEQQMKQTGNFRRYKQVFADNPVHDLTYDTAWVEQSEAAALQSMETLEGRLSAAQAHLNKEAIRTAYLAIAEFASEKGDLDGIPNRMGTINANPNLNNTQSQSQCGQTKCPWSGRLPTLNLIGLIVRT